MSELLQIQEAVRERTETIAAAHADWPCRKGCDECCRRLASLPRITRAEWELLAPALDDAARRRIREAASAARPVVCPLLDPECGACLVYERRPVACRAYGFYAERELVLGCRRIESIGRERPGVVWGNHAALEDRLRSLGEASTLAEWLEGAVNAGPGPAAPHSASAPQPCGPRASA